MLRKFFLTLLFFTCSVMGQKYVIGTNKAWGFFAAFFAVLDHLAFCEQNKKIPVVYWSKDSPYFNNNGNAWLNYFLPVSNLDYMSGDKINRDYFRFHPCKEIPSLFFKGMRIPGPFIERRAINSFIKKYIKVKPSIERKINKFYNDNIKDKKTIGLHLRGTDKSKEFSYPSAQVLIQKANQFKDYQFFVATDEQQILYLAKKTLKGKVISYESIRSINGQPVHYNNFDAYKAGEDILIEVSLLSRCDKFIHTESNVSMAVLAFNPDLQNIPMR